MRIYRIILVSVIIIFLSSCGATQAVYNFAPRQDSRLVSSDNLVVIDYKTNTDGLLVEFSIDKLLTIEEMMILNPDAKLLKYTQ